MPRIVFDFDDEQLHAVTNRALRVDWAIKYKAPGRNRSYVQTVPVKALSYSDHSVAEDTNGYEDAQLVPHALWDLKLETTSHSPRAMVSSSGWLPPSPSSSSRPRR